MNDTPARTDEPCAPQYSERPAPQAAPTRRGAEPSHQSTVRVLIAFVFGALLVAATASITARIVKGQSQHQTDIRIEHTNETWRSKLLEADLARYNQKTGAFELRTPQEIQQGFVLPELPPDPYLLRGHTLNDASEALKEKRR